MDEDNTTNNGSNPLNDDGTQVPVQPVAPEETPTEDPTMPATPPTELPEPTEPSAPEEAPGEEPSEPETTPTAGV